jgi:hypothetical protein
MRLFIENTPWGNRGQPYRTWVDFKINGNKVELMYTCLDQKIVSTVTEFNGPVSEDCCVEFFFKPDRRSDSYFNLEINSLGTPHMAYGPSREERTFVSKEYLENMEIKSTMEAGKWILQASFNISELENEFKLELPLRDWLANFYRCGGPKGQYQTWNKIDTPEPDFHRPEFFKFI